MNFFLDTFPYKVESIEMVTTRVVYSCREYPGKILFGLNPKIIADRISIKEIIPIVYVLWDDDLNRWTYAEDDVKNRINHAQLFKLKKTIT